MPQDGEARYAGILKLAREAVAAEANRLRRLTLTIRQMPKILPLVSYPPPIQEEKTLAEMVAFIVDHEVRGRWVGATLALVKAKQRFDDTDEGERDVPTWFEFCERHFPFGFKRANELLGKMDPERQYGRVRCPCCGATSKPSCDCNRALVPVDAPSAGEVAPTALERAARAIAENPEMSNRAIASKIGVDHKTVARARQSPVDSPVELPAARIGLDGRRRKLRRRS
jgi:hypothetical protein